MTDDDFKALIENRLAQWFAQKLQQAPTAEAKQMLDRMQRLVLRAGKRSRPRLLNLTYEGYGGTDNQLLVDIGLGLELQHQFLLVHDDIMDDDVVRYDGPNMLGYYRQDFLPEQSDIAESMALMAGDLLFTFANEAVLHHPTLAAQQKVAILELMQEANIGVQAGQQLDIVNVLELEPHITVESLQQTDYLKTALYSVRLPMQVAATLANVDETQRQKVDEFARVFGILYQLVDDYSDYFVNDSSFNNHPKYRDYQQGKITYPLLFALEHASEDEVKYLKEHAGKKEISEDVLQHATEILDNCGAKTASQEQINAQYEKAVESLAELTIDNTIRAQFIKMLDEFKL